MRNIILLTLAALILGGCSEMRIMTAAAFKEMNSDIVNLEQEGYRRNDVTWQQPEVVAQAKTNK